MIESCSCDVSSRSSGVSVGGFGEKFRQERERRGLTLDDVSNVTKISSRMLKAIEQDRFDVLPGGVFNKGFIRAYSKTLGFNPEESISEYLAALSQAQIDAQNAPWDQPSALSGAIAQPSQKTTPSDHNSTDTANAASSNFPSHSPAHAASVEVGQAQSFESASPLPIPLVQPPAAKQSSPPPLWISPTLKRPSSSTSATSRVPVNLPPPSNRSPAPELPQPLVVTRAQQSIPQVAVEQLVQEQVSNHAMTPAESKEAAPTAPAHYGWKFPILIVAVGVLVIAAILWTHHTRRLALGDKTAATTSSSASNGGGGVGAGTEKSSPSTATASSSTSNPVSTTPTTSTHIQSSKLGADAPAEEPESPTVATKAANPREPQAPAIFRVVISASKNCWISVTADGALVSRENLIAPANTSVKASHEITVQVSDPAAITFRWNDHVVSPQGTGSEAKTFVFNNAGLRNSLP